MIEPTADMVIAAMEAFNSTGAYEPVVKAVLAIVERDYDARYARLLAANRKLVERLQRLHDVEDARDEALGALEDARRQLARKS